MAWSVEKGSHDISPADQDVRTRAHEYGGGAFVAEHGRRFLINNKDQQLYELLPNRQSIKITSKQNFRYADPVIDKDRNLIYSVGEDHSDPDNVVNTLLKIEIDGDGHQKVIAAGHDFYSDPRLSPDGRQLLFLTWDHPDMPWDGTQLWLGNLDEDGNLNELQVIAGGAEESIFQPLWDPRGNIYFISDRSGWWNIYEYSHGKIRCLLEMEAEFGLPQWVFGMSTYAVLSSGKLIASYRDLKGSHLILIDVKTGEVKSLDVDYSEIGQVQGSGNLIAFIGSSPELPPQLISMDLNSRREEILQRATEFDLPDTAISTPELITFEARPGEPSYAWYYPPLNPSFEAPQSEKPPLIVLSHGGPTSYSPASFSLTVQYWTSRGFALVDVNYSGSTGFGRKYRERLNGNWGIRDVEDCVAAAEYLVQSGKVDGDRLIIKGGSAGGYSTLAALAFKDVFKAGASYYGVGDLELLVQDTHKFESRYLDRLVGKYPDDKSIYRNRSPLYHTDQLDCPVIFLQGLDDPVVPPNQAETMLAALRKKGIPVAYVPFEGEAHGFRQATTIVKAIESEFYFYAKVFGIEPFDTLGAIEIYNL